MHSIEKDVTTLMCLVVYVANATLGIECHVHFMLVNCIYMCVTNFDTLK